MLQIIRPPYGTYKSGYLSSSSRWTRRFNKASALRGTGSTCFGGNSNSSATMRSNAPTILMKVASESHSPSSKRLYVRRGTLHWIANSCWESRRLRRSARTRSAMRAQISSAVEFLAFSKLGIDMAATRSAKDGTKYVDNFALPDKGADLGAAKRYNAVRFFLWQWMGVRDPAHLPRRAANILLRAVSGK